jgi:hypothetical protein
VVNPFTGCAAIIPKQWLFLFPAVAMVAATAAMVTPTAVAPPMAAVTLLHRQAYDHADGKERDDKPNPAGDHNRVGGVFHGVRGVGRADGALATPQIAGAGGACVIDRRVFTHIV